MRYEAQLPDGSPLLFRPLERSDAGIIAEAFKHLSPASRYTRFFQQISELSQAQLRYLTEVDQVDHVAWVAGRPGDPGEGIGIVRWIRLKEDPAIAEVAVTVIDEYQKNGIGRTLLMVAGKSAREHGIERFRAWVIGENRATLHMLETMGGIPGRWEGGVLQVDVPLPPDPGAMLELAPLRLQEVASPADETGPRDPAGLSPGDVPRL